MAKMLKYGVLTLIEFIRSRPCLLDKFADWYKDKILEQKAWKEVFMYLLDDFLDMDKKIQVIIFNIIYLHTSIFNNSQGRI